MSCMSYCHIYGHKHRRQECKASLNIDFPGDTKLVTESRESREMLRIINTRTTNTTKWILELEGREETETIDTSGNAGNRWGTHLKLMMADKIYNTN